LKNIQVELKGAFIRNLPPSLPVLSRHRGVINLLNRETGCLISLVEENRAMTGMSLHVPGLFESSLPLPHPGQTVSIPFDFSGARVWSGTPPRFTADLRMREKELDVLKRRLEGGDSFFSLLTGQYRTAFQKKAREILNRQIRRENGILTGLEQLSGLGAGLTPSGDDFITGALLADRCRPRSPQESCVPGIDRKGIRGCLEGTTTAGRTLLHLALEGSFPAYLLTYLNEASESRDEGGLLAAAEKVSRHGSTSGRDALAGFYWYYDYIRVPLFQTAAGFRDP